MKTLLITCGFVCISLFSYSQNIYQIRADSVRIYNTCDTAELIIENRTQNVPGFLYNKGKGRTEFRKLTFDSTLVLGAYKNNAAGDSVLTTDSNGVVKLVHKSTLGGGGSIPTLQQVTDTGNATTNQIRITGDGRAPVTGDAAIELGTTINSEWPYQGTWGNIRVRDRQALEDDWDPSQAGYLNVESRGVLLQNTLEAGDSRLLLDPYGNITAYHKTENGAWNNGPLYLTGDRLELGGGNGGIKLSGSVSFATIGSTFSNGEQYVGPYAYTYMIRHAATVHLPPATAKPGRVIFVKKLTNTGTVTIDVESAIGQIDNGTSVTISGYLSTIQFQSDGSNWWILSRMGN
jgi:hypothetical protein